MQFSKITFPLIKSTLTVKSIPLSEEHIHMLDDFDFDSLATKSVNEEELIKNINELQLDFAIKCKIVDIYVQVDLISEEIALRYKSSFDINQLVGVQPMTHAAGTSFSLRYKCK